MEIKDLNKSQLILLTLLVSFVVSIATGITAVSLMQQLPTATQTINRVIERTINNVTAPAPTAETTPSIGDGNVLVDIYASDFVQNTTTPVTTTTTTTTTTGASVITTTPTTSLGQGVIISDVGLVLVENTILQTGKDSYQVMLDKKLYQAKVLKSFGTGMTIIKIVTQ